jgi:hypothetical protein
MISADSGSISPGEIMLTHCPSSRVLDLSPVVAESLHKSLHIPQRNSPLKPRAYSDDVDGRFQRDVDGHSGHVNKVGAQRRWDYNHARHPRD